jgi:uncharacterized protein (TIGR03118 family)
LAYEFASINSTLFRDSLGRVPFVKKIVAVKPKSWLTALSACVIGILLVSNARAAGTIIYHQTDLVSDLPGAVQPSDPNLLNAWGMAFLPGSPFWVNANGNGTSNLYDGAGVIFSELPRVKIPPPTATPSVIAAPTGIVANPNNALAEGTDFTGDAFIFDSEDGIISGWQPADGGEAAIHVDNSIADGSSKNAVYKGLAIANTSDGKPHIYATNFRQNTIDVFDVDYNQVTLSGNFKDGSIPKGYAPFNIAPINGKLFVTYALQDAAKHDDVAGQGHGFIDVFTTGGVLVRRFASGGVLNSPWGLVLAPKNFGFFGGKILVGNFGDGHIWAFDPNLGLAPLGQLWTHSGFAIKPLVIDGLWSLTDGTGALNATKNAIYFSAGPNHEADGLFGTLTATP